LWTAGCPIFGAAGFVVADRARGFVFADRVRSAAALRRLEDIAALRHLNKVEFLTSLAFGSHSIFCRIAVFCPNDSIHSKLFQTFPRTILQIYFSKLPNQPLDANRLTS
jgi:hypothetical protein